MYEKLFKRVIDFIVSLAALIILSPLLLILVIVGAIMMKGNPFFLQLRPGRIDPKTGKEKLFRMIKLRTMTNEKDENGDLLPDEQRITTYGRWLRSVSADELFEFVNILKGDMSLIGPRPLLVKYLPLYTDEQRCRHQVRPGLTGYAQVNGRNAISWEEKFSLDVAYVDHITFVGDMKILLRTVVKVFQRDGISSDTAETMEEFTGRNMRV